jgi:uncharacterized repeat protein (TIGR03987 family)
MSPQLIVAVVTILLAAVLYTIAVFAEHRSGVLKPWHVALFWAGLVADTTSTTLMSGLAGGFEWNLHGSLGVLAIVLMLVHAVWATVAIVQRKESVLLNFHKFSLTVWGLWMASLLTGFGIAIPSMMGG